MKYKVGDKVQVVKPEGVGIGFNGRTGIRYLVDGVPFTWGENELKLVEENQGKESIFDKLAHSIAEAAKEANILVEQTEDGGIKISSLEVMEEDLTVDTPCMVSHYGDINFMLRYYAGNKECYDSGNKSKSFHHLESWNYIIPFDRFNPNNIEESLKYNIVK